MTDHGLIAVIDAAKALGITPRAVRLQLVTVKENEMKLNELDPKVTYTMCDDQLAQAPYNDTGAGIVEMCRECFGNEPGFVDPDDDETDYHIEEASSHFRRRDFRG